MEIKIHKKSFPERAYVSQIDDPSYKICKVLNGIIYPLDEKEESYMKDPYHFKELLTQVDIEEGDIIAIVGMLPKIPVKKAVNDESLMLRTDWKLQDVSKLLEVSV